VATKRRSVTNDRHCEESSAEPGGSPDCSLTTYEWPCPTYRVNYSFKGQPTASDEYGNAYFTFSVYFRPDELSPSLRRAISSGSISRTAAAEAFELTTSRDSVQRTAVDQPNSTFCDGNYLDGNWTRKDPKCQDDVAYKAVVSSSSYITAKVDPAFSRFGTWKGQWRQ